MNDENNCETSKVKELRHNEAKQGLRLIRAFQKLSPSSRDEVLKMVESRADNQTG